MALQFGGILPYEFMNYLSANYKNSCDLIFYIDKNQSWYHKGLDGITNTIDETVLYLNNNIIKNNVYEKIIFMGTSAGGYGAILFGSLCNMVDFVISFIPQTILKNPVDINYINLKPFINVNTKYILYGDTNVQNVCDYHHISHCENLEQFINVKIIKNKGCDLKGLRDSGVIKKTIDSIIFYTDEDLKWDIPSQGMEEV
jgi:hypothetical protein